VKSLTLAFSLLFYALTDLCAAQQPAAQPSPQTLQAAPTDVYLVHFSKAAPGKAQELQKSFMTPAPETPMPTHVLLLVHREGDDWDFGVIAHEGPSFTVKAGDVRPSPARELRAWHNDTLAVGPAWPEFARAMGIATPQAGAQPAGNAIYILTTYRGAPGQRDQLLQTLQRVDKAARKPGNSVILRHAEGSTWDYVVITRYDSWQDLAADQGDPQAEQRARSAGFTQSPGLELREYMASHHDTIAERIPIQAPAAAPSPTPR
jgi:hypothetical protein